MSIVTFVGQGYGVKVQRRRSLVVGLTSPSAWWMCTLLAASGEWD